MPATRCSIMPSRPATFDFFALRVAKTSRDSCGQRRTARSASPFRHRTGWQIADHDAEDRGPLVNHLSRQDVGPIAKLFDRLGDLGVGLWRDVGERRGSRSDGRLRHVRAFGDVEDRRRLAG